MNIESLKNGRFMEVWALYRIMSKNACFPVQKPVQKSKYKKETYHTFYGKD
jgi:hypothetical protein